jgi:hypothetical protein
MNTMLGRFGVGGGGARKRRQQDRYEDGQSQVEVHRDQSHGAGM